MYQILAQAQYEKFPNRLRWERLTRVKFSKTARMRMRDPHRYSAESVRAAIASKIADARLGHFKARKMTEEFATEFGAEYTVPPAQLVRIYARI